MQIETDLTEIVINSRMNRGRGLTGVNSYQRELRGFDIAAFLNDRCNRFPERSIRWLDFGCGEGHALHEMVAVDMASEQLTIVGIDLDIPEEILVTPGRPRLDFQRGDIAVRLPEGNFDLITGVHALHYIKDKLGQLERLYPMLDSNGGVLLAHIDPANVRSDSDTNSVSRDRLWNRALRHAKRGKVEISYRDGLLRIERTMAAGNNLNFQARFIDCRVSDNPNRSGMIAVDSLYQ